MANERIKFRLNDDYKSPEALEYLNGLGRDRNPFECPHLRVLPAPLLILRDKHIGAPPYRYEEGTLMCTEKARYDHTSMACKGLTSRVKLTPEGKLETKCNWPLGRDISVNLKQD